VGFTGHEHDQDLGLVDMKGRIYDPLAARFTSADPVMQAPYWSQGLNRYCYVFNDPVNNVDPSGFQAVDYYSQGSVTGFFDWSVTAGGSSGGGSYASGGGAVPGGPAAAGITGSAIGTTLLGFGLDLGIQAMTGTGLFAPSGTTVTSSTAPAPSAAPAGPGVGRASMNNATAQNQGTILEQDPGGSTWRLNPKAAKVLQGLFDDLATKNGGVPLSVKSVGIVMVPAYNQTSQARQNWVSFRPELLQALPKEQLAEIAHEMTHVLQWYRLGSTVEQRNANWAAREALDQQHGMQANLSVAWNPDGTKTLIDSLIGGDPTRLDVIDRRFTLQGTAYWVQYGYVLPQNPTFSLP
jgi:RHS repeat-associated protein